MKSGKESFVEEIRPDSESGIYLKYGYYRLKDGSFIQIGVLAENIYRFLNHFDIKNILNQIKSTQYINGSAFIGNDLTVISKTGMIDAHMITDKAKAAIATNNIFAITIPYRNLSLYQIMVPVFVKGVKFGTLVITHDIRSTEGVINYLRSLVVFALFFLFMLLLFTVFMYYIKNNKLLHNVYYNPLTNLPNKRYFEKAYDYESKSSTLNQGAIIFINYKNFKIISAIYGFQYCEMIIKEMAKRCSLLCTDQCHLFHLYNDRFVFYFLENKDKKELSAFCDSIIVVLKDVLSAKTIGGNIGIVELCGFHGSADNLMKNAYIAARNVDENEVFGYRFFNKEMEEKIKREEYIENKLKNAIFQGEQNENFFMEYQPILDLKCNTIFGFEALACLKSEKYGKISPSEFIPIAEKSQLIIPLGKLIVRMVCSFYKKLKEHNVLPCKISFNVSAIELLRDNFYPDLMRIFEELQVDSSYLIIELTESIFADNYQVINDKLDRLNANGIDIAIDDFGTGYSSLARERELNVNFLKIDKYFIQNLLSIPSEKDITSDIVSMAHKLGHLVIAEGVEETIQMDYLIENGCDLIQGYLFSRPLSKDNAISFMIDWEKRTNCFASLHFGI